MKRWKLCNALAEIESDDGDWVRYDDASASIRDLEAQVAEANRRTKEMISRTSSSLKREEQTGAALVAMVEASSALAESIEAAVPGLRDNHETSVMEAFVRMMEAQQAAVSAMDGSVEAFQVVRDDGLREMLRLIELANAERDAARAENERSESLQQLAYINGAKAGWNCAMDADRGQERMSEIEDGVPEAIAALRAPAAREEAGRVQWTAGEPPWTDGDALLFQVDLSDGTVQTFIGRVDDEGTMVDLDYGDDIGWQAESVDRWVLLSEVVDSIAEARAILAAADGEVPR